MCEFGQSWRCISRVVTTYPCCVFHGSAAVLSAKAYRGNSVSAAAAADQTQRCFRFSSSPPTTHSSCNGKRRSIDWPVQLRRQCLHHRKHRSRLPRMFWRHGPHSLRSCSVCMPNRWHRRKQSHVEGNISRAVRPPLSTLRDNWSRWTKTRRGTCTSSCALWALVVYLRVSEGYKTLGEIC